MPIVQPVVSRPMLHILSYEQLKRCGRNVISFSFDGASPNGCMNRHMKVWCTKQEIHFAEDLYIYFVCDNPPHVLRLPENVSLT